MYIGDDVIPYFLCILSCVAGMLDVTVPTESINRYHQGSSTNGIDLY